MSGFVATALLAVPLGASLVWTPSSPRPGDLLRLRVAGTATAGVAELGGQRYALVRDENGLAGYLAIPIESEEQVSLVVRTATASYFERVALTSRSWAVTKLRVGRKFTRKKHPQAVERRLLRERREIAKVWAPSPTALRSVGNVVRPTRSRRRTGFYGTRRVFNGELQSRHYGLDLAGGVGVPVRAMLPGRVVMSSDRYYSGGTLVLDHGGGLFSLYFHLSKRKVRLGAKVRAGQRIGAVGRSGRVTGPHLHLSVGVRAQPMDGGPPRVMYVDPEPVLAGVLGQAP